MNSVRTTFGEVALQLIACGFHPRTTLGEMKDNPRTTNIYEESNQTRKKSE